MSWKLFIDDERSPVESDWAVVRTVEHALSLILRE